MICHGMTDQHSLTVLLTWTNQRTLLVMMMSPKILQVNPSSRLFGLANVNPKYRMFDADDFYRLILDGSSSSTWLISLFVLYCFGHGSVVILWLRVYIHWLTTCAMLYGIICPSRSLHCMYVETRTATKQVMVPESSRENFAIAKNQATMKGTVNQGGIIAGILSYFVSHGRTVKIRILHACRIWIWKWNPGTTKIRNFLLLAYKFECFVLYIVSKLLNI